MGEKTLIPANNVIATVIQGDCLVELDKLEENSVDAIVTDPPYEIGFMGRKWDKSGITFKTEVWQKCLRVLKPGGHLLAFGAPRNNHRLACAIEDAGFEIRDSLMWLFGNGFPKALDVSKAIDKELGVESKIIGNYSDINPRYKSPKKHSLHVAGGIFKGVFESEACPILYQASSHEAQPWLGWKTSLKPAYEPIVIARKPLDGTVAQNTLKWGVGGLNIDGCRIPHNGDRIPRKGNQDIDKNTVAPVKNSKQKIEYDDYLLGRFPANVLLDEEVEKMLDEQSSSQASRFFYTAKAQSEDRNQGLDSGKCIHPTVKPTDLMQYLVRLVCPKGGVVLDPFMGSGSTGKAALLEQINFVGIERETEYFEIAKARIDFLNVFDKLPGTSSIKD